MSFCCCVFFSTTPQQGQCVLTHNLSDYLQADDDSSTKGTFMQIHVPASFMTILTMYRGPASVEEGFFWYLHLPQVRPAHEGGASLTGEQYRIILYTLLKSSRVSIY